MQAQVRVNIKNVNASAKKRNISLFSLDCAPICMSHVCTSLYRDPGGSSLCAETTLLCDIVVSK